MAASGVNDAATLPDDTAHMIAAFERAVDEVRIRPHHPQVKRRLREVYRIGAELKTHSGALTRKLESGERWLQANPDHPMFIDREDAWIAWLHEYEAIEDALERGKEVL